MLFAGMLHSAANSFENVRDSCTGHICEFRRFQDTSWARMILRRTWSVRQTKGKLRLFRQLERISLLPDLAREDVASERVIYDSAYFD